MRFFRTLLPIICLPILSLSGCRKDNAPEQAPPQPTGPPKVSEEVIQKHKPNEAGAVMIVMYHRFLSDEKDTDLNRRPETFRKDLETFYQNNYYPVNALDFVQNNMDVPAGKTPIILTFDDALPSQFRVIERDGEPKIDPDSAVGIMEDFNKKYPDWPLRGTFFVLPKAGRNTDPFGQSGFVTEKFEYLASKGYEIANHTATHSSLRGMKADEVQEELATAKKLIKEINAAAQMETLALPYGQLPRDESAAETLMAGESGGVSYEHKAVFLSSWRPVVSPLLQSDKKVTQSGSFALFNPAQLERVTPNAGKPQTPGTLEYWLDYFKKHPSLRYISDGEPKVAAIPESQRGLVDEERAAAQGKTLQFYGGTNSGKSGSTLSVD